MSGKHAFAEKLKSLGYDISTEDQINLFKQFKEVADKKKSVSDRDIHAIIQGSEHEQRAIYQLENLQLQYVSKVLQSAVVVIKDKMEKLIKIQVLEQVQSYLYIMLLIVFSKERQNLSIIGLTQSLKVQMRKQKFTLV